MLERRERARQYADLVAGNVSDSLRSSNCPELEAGDITVPQLALASQVAQTPVSAWFPPRAALA